MSGQKASLSGRSILHQLSPMSTPNGVGTASLKSGSKDTQVESPFDNVLRLDDISRANTLVSIHNFLHTYPPRLTLGKYFNGKKGDEGFSETLLLLIEHGIYPVMEDFLIHAMKHFQQDKLLKILEAMKEHGLSGKPGKVVHFAVKKGHLQVLKIFDSVFKLSLNAFDDKNQTPIFYFIEGDEREIPGLYFPASTTCKYGDMVLNDDWIFMENQDCYSFRQDVWDFLISKKVKLNLIDDFGETPLSLAIRLDRQEIIMNLLKNNSVDVDLCFDDQPPFHVYCEESLIREDIFKMFLTRVVLNRQINRRNFQSRIPLHCLLTNCFGLEDPVSLQPFISKLVESGSDLSCQDGLGMTPLMLALHHNYPFEILKLLIPKKFSEACFSLNLTTNSGYNAMAMALLKFKGDLDAEQVRNQEQMSGLALAPNISHPRNSVATNAVENGNSNQASCNGFDAGDAIPPPCKPEKGPKEKSLEVLLQIMLDKGCKFYPYVESKGTKKENRETLLSSIIENKHVSSEIVSFLLKKGLVKVISFQDIWSCLVKFRLDVLYELIKFTESRAGKDGTAFDNLMYSLISRQKGLSINIVDHVYSFRHIYLAASTGEVMSKKPGLSRNSSSNSLSSLLNPLSLSEPSLPGLPLVTRSLALLNLSRVHEIVSSLVTSFGHSVNHVIKQQDSVSKDVTHDFTLIHAVIQAHSWVALPKVLDYLLVDMAGQLNVNVVLEGRGSPLNYAIRLGEFSVADRLLDLNADVSTVDLRIPVIPLKKGFSNTLRRLMEKGVMIPREFGLQVIHQIQDHALEVEYFLFMDEVRNQDNHNRRQYNMMHRVIFPSASTSQRFHRPNRSRRH